MSSLSLFPIQFCVLLQQVLLLCPINCQYIRGAFRDLVPFVQFQKREKHLWRSVNFSKVAGQPFFQTFLFFQTIFKLYKWYQTAQRISALLCLARYPLLVITLHPAKRCSVVSFCSPHILHLSHSVNPCIIFHAFVSTICSHINIAVVVLRVKFCPNHRLHF